MDGCDERHLLVLAPPIQSSMEGADGGVVAGGGHGGHVENGAHGGTHAPDAARPSVPVAVVVQGDHAVQRGQFSSGNSAMSTAAMTRPTQAVWSCSRMWNSRCNAFNSVCSQSK